MTSVRTVDPTVNPDWAHLSASSPLGSLFSSPLWLRAVCSTYGFEARAELVVDEEGRVGGGVAYAKLRDGRGGRAVSFPFTDYCDPIVGTDEDWRSAIGPIVSSGGPLSMRVLRAEPPLGDERFEVGGTVRWHATSVTSDEDEQWRGLSGSARRNIRKARRAGVEVVSSDELSTLRTFYDLHARVRKYKYRLLPQPWPFFEALHREFAGRGLEVLLARRGETVIGGVVMFAWADTFYYKFNASDLGELEVRPNDLLAWEAIASARRRRLSLFDWGVSDEDQPGLIRYKQKFATDERTVSSIRLRAEQLREGPDPSLDPTFGPALGELTAILTDDRVPDELTERAGATLYRYFG